MWCTRCKSLAAFTLVLSGLFVLISAFLLLLPLPHLNPLLPASPMAQRSWSAPTEDTRPGQEPMVRQVPTSSTPPNSIHLPSVTTTAPGDKPALRGGSANRTRSPLPLESSSPEQTLPEVGLFSTWADRPYKRSIHDTVLSTWPLLSGPRSSSVSCLLFSEQEAERQRARSFSWAASPLPNTSCGGVPILREMFHAAMAAMPSARLLGFVNGDILLGETLTHTLHAVLGTPFLMARPLLLLVRRINVPFNNTGAAITSLRTVERLKGQGQPLSDGSSDAFFTNRLFPWRRVPDVVPGRLGVGMWLVAAARALKVAVVDLSEVVTAVHLTSSAGDLESHGHANAGCNHELFKRLGVVPRSWACGFIDCAQYVAAAGVGDSEAAALRVQIVSREQRGEALPTFCDNCWMNVDALLKGNR